MQFEFHVAHPLYGYYHQRLNSKMACSVHTGRKPPCEPRQLGKGVAVTQTWLEKRAKFAAFYVANFVPWEQGDEEEDCQPCTLTPETLRGWHDHLSEVACSQASNIDEEHERTIARGRLFAMRQFAHALTIDNTTKRLLTLYRARNRETWSDREAKETKGTSEGGKTGGDDAVEAEINEFVCNQRTKNIDPTRVEDHAAQESYLDGLLASMKCELPPSEEIEAAQEAAVDPPRLHDTTTLCEWGYCDIAMDVAKRHLDEVVKLLPPVEQTNLSSQSSGPSLRRTVDEPSTDDAMPLEFVEISASELEQEVKEWEEATESAQKQGIRAPDPPLNHEQRAIGRAVIPALNVVRAAKRRHPKDWRKAHAQDLEDKKKNGEASPQFHFLLSGAAGTGKTEVIKVIRRVLEERGIGTLALSAYTGAAVVQLENAVTLLTLLDLDIQHPHQQQNLSANISESTRTKFARYVDVSQLVVLVIDEISFVNATLLHHVNTRLQSLLENDAPFGGLVVLLAGDFHQKETTTGTAMHKALLERGFTMPKPNGELREKKLKKSKGVPNNLGAEELGIALFKACQRFSLRVTHRFKRDPMHGDNLADMRNTKSEQPIGDRFLECLRPVAPSERERFAFAPIGVVSNLERCTLNAAQAYSFASAKKRVLVRWRLPLVGKEALGLGNAYVDELYASEPGLWGYFVAGAPCVITENIAQGRGLVNGTRGSMHSLVLNPDSGDNLRELLSRARPGGVVTLTRPPKYVNVSPDVSDKFVELLRPHSLSEEVVVVPMGLAFKAEEFKPGSTFAAMNGIGVPQRRRKKTGALTKKKTSGLAVKEHCVTLAFAVTDFKLQGASLDALVVSLAPRPFRPPIDLSSVYVLASRVRTRDGLRVLRDDPAGWEHLKAMRHAPELEVWESSYDENGFFCESMANSAISALVRRLRDAFERNKRAKAAQKKAKKAASKAAAKVGDQAKKGGVQTGGRNAPTATPHTKKHLVSTGTVVGGEARGKRPSPTTIAAPKAGKAPTMSASRPHLGNLAASNSMPLEDRLVWAQSCTWLRNSCWVDAPAKMMHLGKLSLAHITGR